MGTFSIDCELAFAEMASAQEGTKKQKKKGASSSCQGGTDDAVMKEVALNLAKASSLHLSLDKYADVGGGIWEVGIGLGGWKGGPRW